MPITKGYVGPTGQQVHYRTAGEGDSVVLLHMTASSSLSWEPVVIALANSGYRAIAFDSPGFGNSNQVEGEPSITAWAARLADAASALGLDRYVLFGHHTGGTVGAMIAANHPERVRAFAAYGFPANDAEHRARGQQAKPIPFTESGKEVSDRWTSWKRMVGERFTPEQGMTYVLEALQAGHSWYDGHMLVAMVDPEALARRVTAPTLLMGGPRDTGWEHGIECAPWFPDAETYVFDGAGIDIYDQFPSDLAAKIDDFSRRKALPA